MINLLLFNNFYPVIYRRDQKESDELLCTVRSLVTVREPVASASGLKRSQRRLNLVIIEMISLFLSSSVV